MCYENAMKRYSMKKYFYGFASWYFTGVSCVPPHEIYVSYPRNILRNENTFGG